MYGFTIPDKAKQYVLSMLAGTAKELNLVEVVVGSGIYEGDEVSIRGISDLVEPVTYGSTTTPVIDESGKLRFTVIYQNDMNGGLKEDFLLAEFGVYAKVPDSEKFLLYYGTLGEFDRQRVRKLEGNTVDIRRFPVEIQISTDVNITVSYDCSNYATSDDFEAFKNELTKKVESQRFCIDYIPETETLVFSNTSSGGSSGTEAYTLPIASEDTLGGVRIGEDMSIDSTGRISPETEEFTEAEIQSLFNN